MDRNHIIARLRENEAALFGSPARGDSDTDILIEIDPAAHVTVFDYVGLNDHAASLFEGQVDGVNREGLEPYARPAAMADAIHAF